MRTVEPERFRAVMGHFATGVAVVTVDAPGGPQGMTANAVASLSLDPPLMLACLDRGSRTLEVVRATGAFGVSVLSAGQAQLAQAFASKAPHTEKFREVPFEEREGVPILDGAVAWVACSLHDLHPGGDHEIAVGDVLAVGGDGGDPLVFYAGAYRPLD